MVAFIILLLTFVVYLIVKIKKKYSYWRMKGVNGPTPFLVIGNFGPLFFFKESLDVFTKRIYEEHPNEKVVGLFKGFSPVLLIRDPVLVKQMLISDAEYFLNRGTKTGETGLNNSLFSLEGDSWKFLRKKLTPLFTLNKLKSMLPSIQRSVDNFVKHVESTVDSKKNADIKSLMAKYTADVIMSCLFGFQTDIFNGDTENLEEIGAQIFAPSVLTWLWYRVETVIPGIHKLFGSINPTFKSKSFFFKLVYHAARNRESKELNNMNFLDLMIDLKQSNNATEYDDDKPLKVTDELIGTETYTFYGAGYHSSAMTMAFLAHELAFHQNIQDRLHKEILAVTNKHDGKLNIDTLKEMTYLQMVLFETLRKNTTIGWLIRSTEKDYIVPEMNLTIEKGTTILISTGGIHSDPKYFHNPEKFYPENFSPENKKNIPHYLFSPFGVGPRSCIGVRFAEIQMMMAIAAFFMRFKVEPCEKTERRLRYDAKSISLNTPSGIWLKITRRLRKPNINA